jgi:malate dehydrogenase (oxaloacetate-decarboxylating)
MLSTKIPYHAVNKAYIVSRTRISVRRYPSISLTTKYSTMPPSKDHSSKFSHLPLTTSGPQDCAVSGTALLNTPYFNKGSAFSAKERVEFNLTGLLPHNVQTLEQQVQRAYEQYSEQQDDLAKNTFMTSMRDQNEVLFYQVCLTFYNVATHWNHTHDASLSYRPLSDISPARQI